LYIGLRRVKIVMVCWLVRVVLFATKTGELFDGIVTFGLVVVGIIGRLLGVFVIGIIAKRGIVRIIVVFVVPIRLQC